MSSTVFPARRAVWGILTATFTDGTVQTSWGEPKSFEQQRVVALLGVGSASEDFVLLGPNQPLDEKYSIGLRIKVHDPAASDGQSLETTAETIYNAVRDGVRADATLGGALVLPARTNSPRTDGAFQPEDAAGWAMFWDFTIDCFGRAT